MCVIAAKPVGIKMPTTDVIEDMWFANPDGAGFMYAENGVVHIRKGFMKLDNFLQAIDDLAKTHDLTKLPVVMHFRITTHGGTRPENTHPFPISDSIGILSKSKSKCRLGVAHNGIINITPRKDISDTMEYIASQLAPLSRAVPDFYKSKDLMEMIYNAVQSKLAFLTDLGEIYTVGDFKNDNGILFSNTYFKYKSYRDFDYGKVGCYSWDSDPYYYDGYPGLGYGMTGWNDPEKCVDIDEKHGTFYTDYMMWITEDDGYVLGADKYDASDSFAINKNNVVFVYDCDLDALVKVPGALAKTIEGTNLQFDYDSDNAMLELVYRPSKKS